MALRKASKKKKTKTSRTNVRKAVPRKAKKKATVSKKKAVSKTTPKSGKVGARKKAAAQSAGPKPPAAVRQALKKGLDLRHEYGGRGLVDSTITWAKKLAKGEPITPQKARKMHAYFARHKVDRRRGWDNPPTPGYVAWLLWGGDAARVWVKKVVDRLG